MLFRSKTKNPPRFRGGFCIVHRVEEISVLGRPGSDLLFQVLRLSTIGAGEFNGRVRDGIGFRPSAKTTRSAKNRKRARTRSRRTGRSRALVWAIVEASWNFTCALTRSARSWLPKSLVRIEDKSDQADRAIRTGKLNISRCLHTRPINVVVYHGSV